MPTSTITERLRQLLVDNRNRILPLASKDTVKTYASLRDGCLSLEVRSPDTGYLPDFIEGTHGIQVEIDKGNKTLGARVIFTSKEPNLNIVFFSLAENLCISLEESKTEKDAVRSALRRFEDFRELMQSERRLSKESSLGLIAEHLLLIEYLDNPSTNYEKLLQSWRGPFGGNKDFVFGRQGFEVKSIRPNATSIKVSSAEQLDPNKLDLYLLTYSLDNTCSEDPADGTFSLRSLVDYVRDKLSDNRVASNIYNIAISNTGYNKDEHGFVNVRYRLQKKTVYAVKEGFPKIIPSQLPAGVENLTYSVKISTIQKFELEMKEISVDL